MPLFHSSNGRANTCITCRKAFTFAEGVARADIRNKWNREPSEEDVESWIEAMKEILADVQVGVRYVIIDGLVIQADAANTSFDGWAAHHEFTVIPQVRALTNKAVLEEELSNCEYWSFNALPEDE